MHKAKPLYLPTPWFASKMNAAVSGGKRRLQLYFKTSSGMAVQLDLLIIKFLRLGYQLATNV